MPIVQYSTTPRFILQYDDAIAPARQLAETLSHTIEQDFFFMRRYLPNDQGASPDTFQRYLTVVMFIDASSKTALHLSDQDAAAIPGRGGARNHARKPGRGGTIWLNAFGATNQPLTPDFARFLFIAEMSEQLMDAYGWDPGSSRGESLSRVLAEEFFPRAGYAPECISIAPWCNDWLNSSPRFDYLNQNPSPTPANKNLGTDLDGLGYGCGILFINYLRFQLGYPLDAICQAGGPTFVDGYKNLTARTDDPLAAMNDLLAKHYGKSYINLLDNNPFPLLDAKDRRVTVGFERSVKDVPTQEPRFGHVAHVSPFLTCPVKRYHYHRYFQAVTQTFTATAIGFARPIFTWRFHGNLLLSSAGARDEVVTFDVPDPDHPRVPTSASGKARFDWTYTTRSAAGELPEGVLVVTNDSFDGVYHLDVKVEVAETFDGDTTVSADVTLDFESVQIVYEPQFYEDLKVCEGRFQSAVAKLHKEVDLVLDRPDPPRGRPLEETIKAVDAIRIEIAQIHQRDPQLGKQAIEYAATRLQIDPKLLVPSKVVS